MKNLIKFTHYKSPDPLTKRYWKDGDSIHKQAAAEMYRGAANRVSMPFCDLVPMFSALGSNEALGYGVHPLSLPDEVKIVIQGKENLDQNKISRGLSYYKYLGAGILFLDHDPSPFGKSLTADELIAVITLIHPEFEYCEKIIRGSLSAGVHLVGEAPRTDKGFHIYIPVTDTSLLKEYGDTLGKHLWIKDYGFIALAKNGNKLKRTCIDGAVFSPERLDFAGAPVIAGEGLAYTAPEIRHIKGDMLDLSTLPELDEVDLSLVNDLIEAAKEAIDEDSKDKAEVWAVDKIAQMEVNGTEEAKARKIVYTMLSGGCKDICDAFILEFAHGELVTVADVVANHKKYDDKALADPIEGVAYGKATAKFYWNNGKPFINSFAHGGAKYFLHSTIELMNAFGDTTKEKPDYQIKYDEHCEKWNLTHMSTLVGGVHRIARVASGDVSHDGRDTIEFCTNDALFKVYGNTFIQTGTKLVNGYAVPVYKNHFEAWRTHTKSKSFTGGVVFKPNSKVPANCFNMWQGYSVKPLDNPMLLTRLKHHIERVVCDGDAELYGYLYKWIAYTFQCPEKPAGAAVVLRGEEGAGKGILASFIQSIWGKHGYKVGTSKHLTGAFNAHLADVCFLFADEAFFSGDRQQADVLKGLVTESTMTIERKGVDSITQPNYLKIFMSTNSEYAVPAGRDSRRYFVTDVSSLYLKNETYFDALVTDCNNDAVKSAFLYEMLNMDLTGFKTSQIPESKGLRSQRYHAMDSAQHWLVDVLLNGSFRRSELSYGWVDTVQSSELYENYQEWAVLNKISEFRMFNQCRLMSYLNKIYKAINHVRERGRRGLWFGTYSDACASFEAFEGVCLAELATFAVLATTAQDDDF